MLKPITAEKKEDIRQFCKYLYHKYRENNDKSFRARKQENIDKFWERRNRYWDTFKRWTPLYRQFPARIDYELRLEKKEERRIEFQTKHTYSMWFFSNSLGADYGQYQCNNCQRTFYHSPATIKLAAKVVYACACGYCTNNIIERDWNETPYD